jgi:CheY-like chemotaxis protein
MQKLEELPKTIGHALVIDDDENSRVFFAATLKKVGYSVDIAEDGLAALRMCETSVFDLVLCDIRMPKLSGISFLRNVRVRSPKSVHRIYFVTSMDDVVIKREAMEAGADGFLIKPVSTSTLIQAVVGGQ